MIEVSIAHDEAFNALSEWAQLLFLRILPHTDDVGRFSGVPRVIKARVYPMSDRNVPDFLDGVVELISCGLVAAYIAENDDVVLQFNQLAFARINAVLVKNSKGVSEYANPKLAIPLEIEEYRSLILSLSPRAKHVPVTCLSRDIVSKEYKVESRKQKAEGGVGGDEPETSTILATAERILAAYPRQASLGPGVAAVTEQLQHHDAGLVLERTQQYAAAVATMPKRYIPYPARWYSEQRFLENPAEWTTATKQPATWFTREEVHRMRERDPGIEKRLECWKHGTELVYRHPTTDAAPVGYQSLYVPPSAHGPPENGTSTNGAPPIPSM